MCLSLISFSLPAQIHINEIQSSNANGLADEDGDYPDWIELYNAGDVAVNLVDYAISDDAADLNKWRFPAIDLPAKGFLLIFASDKDRKTGPYLHTNFKISAAGETLYLVDPLENILHQLPAVALSPNESYGAFPDGAALFKYYALPTPGATNLASTALEFSHARGFYTENISLSISCNLPNAEIYYTLDGSIPNLNSLRYTQALALEDRSSAANQVSTIPTTHGKPENEEKFHHWLWQKPKANIAKTNIVRARAYLATQPVSKIYSNSYFIFAEGADRYPYPVISIITAPQNLFDEQTGIYVPGVLHDANNPEWTGNYFLRGSDSERPAHIEYFENDGSIGFHQDAGARIHGGNTRDAAQKSLRMYARKSYGQEHFNYPLFPRRPAQAQFEKFIIRSSITCWNNTIFKDALSHQIVKDLNFDIQDYRPVVLFLNGEYWGMQTLREHNDERYLGILNNLDKDSIEIIDAWNSSDQPEYEAFKSFYSNEDLSLAANYAIVDQTINLANYIDYQIAEIYFANLDWPGNNLERWKHQSAGSKWNWIFFDLDGGYFDPEMNTLAYAQAENSNHWANPEPTTRLFRKLMQNEDFQTRFANRFAELLNTTFHPERVLPLIDAFTETYIAGIEEHIERWNFPASKSQWLNDISGTLKYFVVNRTCHLQDYLMEDLDIDVFSPQCFEDTNEIGRLKIYPNPSEGLLQIELPAAKTSSEVVEVYNNLGQRVEQFLLTTNSLAYIDFSNFPTGMYYLRLVSNQQVEKLIIH